MFYLDNFDWLEETPGGKNTFHLFLLSVFHPRINENNEPISYLI